MAAARPDPADLRRSPPTRGPEAPVEEPATALATDQGEDPAADTRAEADTRRAALADGVTFERTWLDRRSWVDVARGAITGADELATALMDGLAWDGDGGQVFRYDHWVDVPRLGSWYALDRPPHPVLHDLHRALQHRYGVRFAAPSVAWYRHERDSVAFHRDRDMRWLDDTRIALLVVGDRRPFLLRPRAHRHAHELEDHGAVVDLAPGDGDLLVMGGGCQAGWEHSVPKLTHRVGPRLSVQWRWSSRTGRQEQGGSYGAPLHFSR